MKLEEKAFEKKRIDFNKLKAFGFIESADKFVYEIDFMDCSFHAVITIFKDGKITGSVIDKMNEDEYTPIRYDRQTGAFVCSVRAAYQALLSNIATNCSTSLSFKTEQANRITKRIAEEFQVYPDFPWDDTSGVFRHGESQKWFALIMELKYGQLLKNDNKETVNAMNLKIDSEKGPELMKQDGIFPAFHMNHKLWITVLLDDTVKDETIMELIKESFELTNKKNTALKNSAQCIEG